MPIENLQIRRAEADDCSALYDMFGSPDVYVGTLQLPYPSREYWRQRLTEREGFYNLVAVAGNRVVGMLGLETFFNRPRRKHAGRIGISVHHDWQGQGVGSALMTAGLDLADNWLNLTRLELEGLLNLRPRTGLVVSVLDMDAVDELYEMRAALEGTAAALAAKHASPKDLAALARLVAEGEKLDPKPLKLYWHNRELHDAIRAAAHNRYLEKSLSALQDAIALLGPTTLAEKGRFAVAQAEHAAIVQAISQRNGKVAERLARAHVLSALEIRRSILAKERDAEARRERDGA